MHKTQKRRLTYLIFFLCGLALAATFIFYALNQNLNVFVTPSQITDRHVQQHYQLRLGGMVKTGSVQRDANTLEVNFIVTDLKQEIPVRYIGVLPDLFHEGKGVIAEGKLNDQGVFIATQVLAKHDENYMPKNVYDAMRKDT